jgi:hypothetical protein
VLATFVAPDARFTSFPTQHEKYLVLVRSTLTGAGAPSSEISGRSRESSSIQTRSKRASDPAKDSWRRRPMAAANGSAPSAA